MYKKLKENRKKIVLELVQEIVKKQITILRKKPHCNLLSNFLRLKLFYMISFQFKMQKAI